MTSIREEMVGKKNAGRWADDTDYILSDGIDTVLLASGCAMADIRLVPKEYGVLLIVRVPRSSEGPRVAFYGAATVAKAAVKGFTDLRGDRKKLKVDEWALKRLDENT